MRFHRLALGAAAVVALCALQGSCVRAEDAASVADGGSSSGDYTPPANAENFQFEAEVNRMLDIVINSLYTNKDIFLRELISNASDALDKARFLSISKPEILESNADLEVRIEYDEEASTLTVRDSGLGMTKDELVANLGTVARSGTTNFVQALGDKSAEIDQIGMFGVGFYSTFLVADRVTVASKHPDDPVQHVWESLNGESSFYVSPDPRGNSLGRGTEITLHLKEDAGEYANPTRLRALAKHYSEFVTHPLHLRTTEKNMVDVEDEGVEAADADADADSETDADADLDNESEGGGDFEIVDEEEEAKPKKQKEVITFSWEHLNTDPAIWTRSKEDIGSDEYQAFWKVVNKEAQGDAATWSHFDAEGSINFKALVYLPDDVPPEMQSGNLDEYNGGLSLYVRKVLISDSFDLMPRYLSFVKGVVDSDDLPLNVNRETLQESKIIKIIRKKLIRKTVEMIRKLATDSEKEADGIGNDKEVEIDSDGNAVEVDEGTDEKPNKYLEWYKNFAPSIKMGVLEDDANRGKLAGLLRYHSSKTENENDYVSLKQYIGRMKDWQDEIYFFSGISETEMEHSQFMDKFQEKDVEVLYFTDPIDEYMMNALPEYDGKKFVSISKEGVKFKDEDEDLVKRREKAYEKQFKPLTKWLKKQVGQDVMRISISKRLGRAPAIVSSMEWGPSANMERIMRAQATNHGGNDFGMRAMKIMEINPRHPFIHKLLELCPRDDDDEGSIPDEAKDAVMMLYDMALLGGGFPISDGKAYTERMTRIMQAQLGVDSTALVAEIDPPEEEEDEAPEPDFEGMDGINLDDFDLGEFEEEDI